MQKFDFSEIQFMIRSCECMEPLRYLSTDSLSKVAGIHRRLLDFSKGMTIDEKVSLPFLIEELFVLCVVVDVNVRCCGFWLRHTVVGEFMYSVFDKLQEVVDESD